MKYITSQHKVLILKPGYFTLLILFDICFSEGKRHDSGMLADSGLLRDLEAYAFSPAGLPISAYMEIQPIDSESTYKALSGTLISLL